MSTPCEFSRHCWHRYDQSRELAGVGLYHCCRLVAHGNSEVEEKSHGYLKGWRRTPSGHMPPRLYAIGRRTYEEAES